MVWGGKERDWNKLVNDIQSEINANRHIIPQDRINDIEHYLNHDEFSMAFEYLCLEIMERDEAVFSLGIEKIKELALFFDLDDENECMVDGQFWPKLKSYLDI